MTLEKLTQENQGALIALMREFYHSPAVLTPVPDAHFEATCAEILSEHRLYFSEYKQVSQKFKRPQKTPRN